MRRKDPLGQTEVVNLKWAWKIIFHCYLLAGLVLRPGLHVPLPAIVSQLP